MIKTNLLPPELQTRKARSASRKAAKTSAAPTVAGGPPSVPSNNASKALVVLMMLVTLLGAGGEGYYIYTQFAQANKVLADTTAAAQKADSDYKKALAENREKFDNWQRLKVKGEILASLMPESRLFWSQKLDMLTRLTPEGVYITGVDVAEKVEMVETDFSKKKRAEFQAALAIAKKKDQDIEKAKQDKAVASGGDKAAKKESSSAKAAPKGPFETALGDEPVSTLRPQITQTLTLSAVTRFDEERGTHREKYLEFQRQLDSYRETTPDGKETAFRDYFVIDRPEARAAEAAQPTPVAQPAAKADTKSAGAGTAATAAPTTSAGGQSRSLTRPPRRAASSEPPRQSQLIFRDGTLRIIPDRQSMEELDGLTVWAFALKMETIPI
ncbi:MAG TPA: hypothetical protein PKH31_03620 [Candidatus Sumerlaeota bacterium]|nr:hypothetical protein [Candidatus Sumerlaeota bacterium]